MVYANSNKVVYGLFETRAALENAIGRLKADGFQSSNISILLPTFEGSTEFTPEDDYKTSETAATGVTGGVVLGGALGWLAGIGTLMIPGLGPFVAAGPILATMGGAGLGGALGGVAGALVGLGISETEANRFEAAVRRGCMLLSVHDGIGDWADEVILILEDCGGHDVAVFEGSNKSESVKLRKDTPPEQTM